MNKTTVVATATFTGSPFGMRPGVHAVEVLDTRFVRGARPGDREVRFADGTQLGVAGSSLTDLTPVQR